MFWLGDFLIGIFMVIFMFEDFISGDCLFMGLFIKELGFIFVNGFIGGRFKVVLLIWLGGFWFVVEVN